MNSEFLIDVKEWLGNAEGQDIEEATYADLLMSAHDGQHCLTLSLHGSADKPCDSIHVPAYLLACWFASNWWRLRWEPELPQTEEGMTSASIDWRMSHKVSGTGGGYQWPNITFASEGEFIRVRSQASNGRRSKLSVRFLNNVDTHISAINFERAVDTFLDVVIKRLNPVLQHKGSEAYMDAADLKGLWGEVCEERKDPELTRWRKTEAILGFDTDDAPEELMQKFLKLMDAYSQTAVEEMMATPIGKHPVDLNQFWEESRSRSFNLRVPEADWIRQQIAEIDGVGEPRAGYNEPVFNSLPPWEQGYSMAAKVRDAWALERGPLPSDVLLDRLGLSSKARASLWQVRKNAVASTGFVNATHSGKLSACIYRSSRAGKRFTLARLVGDYLSLLDQAESLLPVTGAHTSRQKVQRAFAQELLCPYESLREYFASDKDVSIDNVVRAARHFEASSELVLRTLENHSDIDPRVLGKTRLQLAA